VIEKDFENGQGSDWAVAPYVGALMNGWMDGGFPLILDVEEGQHQAPAYLPRGKCWNFPTNIYGVTPLTAITVIHFSLSFLLCTLPSIEILNLAV
jgi:hypothetical protein